MTTVVHVAVSLTVFLVVGRRSWACGPVCRRLAEGPCIWKPYVFFKNCNPSFLVEDPFDEQMYCSFKVSLADDPLSLFDPGLDRLAEVLLIASNDGCT